MNVSVLMAGRNKSAK